MMKSIVSNKEIKPGEAVKGQDIREGIYQLVKKEHPAFNSDSFISLDELNHYRRVYLATLVATERGEVDQVDLDVLKAIKNNTLLSDNIEDEERDGPLTLGERIADNIAEFGGSWTFILSFFSFLLIWMIINIWVLSTKPFDPYPFILLNLILSCLAAIQAPIIMMSQNRQEQKDRVRAEHDYKINLKAELEIKLLSEKIDHLIIHQNRKLLEIQEVQIDYLEDVLKQLNNKN